MCVCVCVCVCIKEYNVCKKWSQDQGTCNEKYIKTSLHPSKTLKATLPLSSPMLALPLALILLSFTKLLPFFVTNDKGCITERSSSHHHTLS